MKKHLASIIVVALIIGALFFIKEHPVDKSTLATKAQQSTEEVTKSIPGTDIESVMSTGDKIASFFESVLEKLGYKGKKSQDAKDVIEKINKTSHAVADITDNFVEEDDNSRSGALDKVTLKRVVDGDTIIVDNNGAEETIRLLEVNTPESVHEDESKNNEYGKMASDFTKAYLASYINDYIYLSYDKEMYDQYDRTLAYVWLTDGVDITNESDLREYCYNAILLEEGMAEFVIYEPNHLYKNTFSELEEVAKDSKIGLWQYEGYKALVED